MSPADYLDIFRHPDILVVLATAPTGFGHLRVTQALKNGLPEHQSVPVLGLSHSSLQFLHRLTSRHVIMRAFFEFFQNNPGAEEVFTRTYRSYLSVSASDTYRALSRLVLSRRRHPRTIILVCTHFSLAHEAAAVKTRLLREYNCRLIISVTVTDDSPQRIWAVPGADFIFVPSLKTKVLLDKYLQRFSPPRPLVIISPYPVAPGLTVPLSAARYTARVHQLQPHTPSPLNILLPVSGAAVQLSYFRDLISGLNAADNHHLTIISRQSPATASFLSWCRTVPGIEVISHLQDLETVIAYEHALTRSVFSLEITKPSEQSFKALLTPHQRGGVILLFTRPVGRQEYDNLDFLRRHRLLPDAADARILNDLCRHNSTSRMDASFYRRAQNWRCLMLPDTGSLAARAITCFKNASVLSSMANFTGFLNHPELRGDGVRIFWQQLSGHIQKIIQNGSARP
ncbi:MAG: hypothetical protein UW51_C0003G0067 [Candidatus Amesbacteria bacterium GW2011_GWA1_44_24]|nr:MAG: hypothetical protein UW51_C0003G0067 [Candidatus Amesbacteria bacterium GW2011_GWA1_44_24]